MNLTGRAALTHFAVLSSESVRTHTSVAACLFLAGASVAAGARSTGIESDWRDRQKGILEARDRLLIGGKKNPFKHTVM